MASKFAAKEYAIPPEFPEILKSFAREVLRAQPANITEFAVKYFERKSHGVPEDGAAPRLEDTKEVEIDNIEETVRNLFNEYDVDKSGTLDPKEFKALFEDLQGRLRFAPDEVYRFLCEVDVNDDGIVEYEEFIPLAIQIIQGMHAKQKFEQHLTDVDSHAEHILVHGMDRDELQSIITSIFERIDVKNAGVLAKDQFMSALTSMELGLTRREINSIMFQIDEDNDNMISYREFVPFAFDLLQKLTALRLLESEMESDDLVMYLNDAFRSQDTEMTGYLHENDIRNIFMNAKLGLSRMQICSVMSQAKVDGEGMIQYSVFTPKAVGLIRSMLSFDKSLLSSEASNAAQQFTTLLDNMLEGVEEKCPLEEFIARMNEVNFLDEHEQTALISLAKADEQSIDIKIVRQQAWPLIRSIRSHQ